MKQSELNALLSERHSKKAIQSLASELCRDTKAYARLIDGLINGREPIPQHAAWVLQHCADICPEMIYPHLSLLIQQLGQNVPDAIKRGILRSMTFIKIPEKHREDVIALCFNFLENPQEAVAIKVHSMQVLWQECRDIPELTNELRLIIENQLPHSSAGFKSRGKKIISEIQSRSTK